MIGSQPKIPDSGKYTTYYYEGYSIPLKPEKFCQAVSISSILNDTQFN